MVHKEDAFRFPNENRASIFGHTTSNSTQDRPPFCLVTLWNVQLHMNFVTCLLSFIAPSRGLGADHHEHKLTDRYAHTWMTVLLCLTVTGTLYFFASATALIALVPFQDARAAGVPYERASLIASLDISCQIPSEYADPHSKTSWSLLEIWAWKQICEGRDANFKQKIVLDMANKTEAPTDPRSLEERTLRSRFLKTILTTQPLRSAIPLRGANISWAYFPDDLDLGEVSIDRPLRPHTLVLFRSSVNMTLISQQHGFASFKASKFGLNPLQNRPLLRSQKRPLSTITGASKTGRLMRCARIGGNLSHGLVYVRTQTRHVFWSK